MAAPIPLVGPTTEEPLRGEAFVSDVGFRVDPLPPGVRFRRAAAPPFTWEVVDGLGERVAIVAARALATDQAPPSSVGRLLAVEDWQGEAAQLRLERFSRNGWVYYVQRRVEGTEFLRERWYNERRISVLGAQ